MAEESSNAANKQEKRKFSDTYSEDKKKITLELLSQWERKNSSEKKKAPKLDSRALGVQDSLEFPISLRAMIKLCGEPFEKELTKSDLGDTRGDLSGLVLNTKNEEDWMKLLLTNKEKAALEKGPPGIPVTTMFRPWATSSGDMYVLACGQWKDFARQDFIR